MSLNSRILNADFRNKIMSADEAAKLILPGETVGMSGFTGVGYPKEIPLALPAILLMQMTVASVFVLAYGLAHQLHQN